MSHDPWTEQIRIWNGGGRWRARCDCGYKSREMGSLWKAEQAASNHARDKSGGTV